MSLSKSASITSRNDFPVLFGDNYAVDTFETASLNSFGVSNDNGILKYSCSEYDWTVMMNSRGRRETNLVFWVGSFVQG
jgi:hypothetical protein